MKAFQYIDNTFQIVRFAHIGLVKHLALDKAHDQHSVFVIDELRAHADGESGIATGDFIGA